jgi:hypothetical protein
VQRQLNTWTAPAVWPLEKRLLMATINVNDYGAVADDGQNDLLAIQAALNASSAGDTILFPGGVYDLTNFYLQQHNSNGNGFVIPGDRFYLGQNGATLRGRDSLGPQVYIQNYSGSTHLPTNNVTISHLSFDQGGIYIDNAGGMNQNIVLDYNTFHINTSGENNNGLTFKAGLRNSRITNNYFTGYNCSFAIFGLYYNTLTLANNEFVNVNAAVHIDALHFSGSGNLLVEQNYITGTHGMGLEFQSEATNLVFQDNWFENPSLSSVFAQNNGCMAFSLILDSSSNITIRRNVVIAPQRPDGKGCRIGFEVGGDNTLVEDNYVNGINHVLAVNDGVGTCSVTAQNNQFLNYLEGPSITYPSSNPLRTFTNINNGPNTRLTQTMQARIAAMQKPGIGAKRYGDPLPPVDPGDETPTAPANLEATDVSASSLTLTWFDESINEDGFEVQMLLADGLTWQQLTFVGADVTAATIPGVPYGSVLRVVAFNGAGYSAGSNSITVVSLPATPTALAGTVLSPNSIDLSWHDNSTDETDFQVQILASDGKTWLTMATVTANVTHCTIDGLACGSSYTFRVVAHNDGGYSQQSDPTQVRTPIPETGGAPTRRARAVLLYQGASSTAVSPPLCTAS